MDYASFFESDAEFQAFMKECFEQDQIAQPEILEDESYLAWLEHDHQYRMTLEQLFAYREYAIVA